MALHIFNLVDSVEPDETEAPTDEVTEAPTEEVTETPTEEVTEAPTAAPETTAPETEAPTAAPETTTPETEAEKSGCGSAIGMIAATLGMAAAAAVVLAKKD
jgi:hypothetical protein